MDSSLLGEILLREKRINRKQLDDAIAAQRDSYPRMLLGEVLVLRGLLQEMELHALLSHQLRVHEIERIQSDVTVAELQKRLRAADLAGFLSVARALGASDLILSSDQRPMLRLHGNLVDLPLAPLAPLRARELLMGCVPEARKPALETTGAADFALEAGAAGRFRVNVFRHVRGLGGTFRVIADEPWVFERLGLPHVVRKFVDFSHGLVLITGPMGSGKSTTLAALLQIINRAQPVHIVTIEDPIEILLASDRAQVSQRQVGTHTPSFADALRSTLREDPDVIAVGELRDPESVQTAISAAETGHLVFGTLHTAGAHRTILRLLDQFPPSKRAHIRSMLATSLRAVVCQQLVPNVDGRGRSLASEILVVNAAASSLIREDRVWQIPMVIQTGAAEGMRLMDEALLDLVRDKRVGLADALARATDRDRFMGR